MRKNTVGWFDPFNHEWVDLDVFSTQVGQIIKFSKRKRISWVGGVKHVDIESLFPCILNRVFVITINALNFYRKPL